MLYRQIIKKIGKMVSNLGLYQKITTYSKKVSGPVNFLLLVAGGGYVVGRIIETGITRTVKK